MTEEYRRWFTLQSSPCKVGLSPCFVSMHMHCEGGCEETRSDAIHLDASLVETLDRVPVLKPSQPPAGGVIFGEVEAVLGSQAETTPSTFGAKSPLAGHHSATYSLRTGLLVRQYIKTDIPCLAALHQDDDERQRDRCDSPRQPSVTAICTTPASTDPKTQTSTRA